MEDKEYAFGTFPGTAMDLDLMDELLLNGCWLETTDVIGSNQSAFSISNLTNEPPLHYSSSESKTDPFGVKPHPILEEETDQRNFLPSAPRLKIEELVETTPKIEEASGAVTWWIGPGANTYQSLSVRDRLVRAIGFLQGLMKQRSFLVQIWVPVKRRGKTVLTTEEQPYSFDPNCSNLARYRDISKAYSFAAEADSNELVGLPGRVFLGKLPEWTPDVRFFRCDEYPRICYARQYNVRGSLALPLFERGSRSCLGVVEIVTTTQKITYRPELENVCRALEAVDLSSSQRLIPQSVKGYTEPYQAASSELASVLELVCRSHGLPLALTWAPCARQGKTGSRHSDENFSRCISTVDSACFVTDEDSRGFLDACSDYHLLRGEGIAGRAFSSNKPCFATEVTAFSKTNYPLSHHARMFGFHAALAIPVRSVYTGLVELVLELFLPKNCLDTEEKKKMLNSLSTTMQHNFRSSYFAMDKEVEEEVIFPVTETATGSVETQTDQENVTLRLETSPEESSWIAHMMEANQMGKGVSLSWEYQKEEPVEEEFKVASNRWDNTQFDSLGNNSAYASGESSSCIESHMLGGQQRVQKRRTKNEKTITLDILRQHFAGSLKDAANSMGVCPTTLKRICRQHGIMRWPSRKIKKVGHSLRKLQLVMDSVQGVQGPIQLSSFYSSFPELSSPHVSPNLSHKIISSPTQQKNVGLFFHATAAPKSPSSSGSQSSSGSSTCSSTGINKNTTIDLNASSSGNTEDSSGLSKTAHNDQELHLMNVLFARSKQQVLKASLPPLPAGGIHRSEGEEAMKVKVTFGESKVRLSLQSNWGFRDLQQEIARRFDMEDCTKFDLKYLDDDKEWVLLTCDDDLQECMDIYRSSQSHRIKISVHQPSQPKQGSFGSIAPS